MKCGNCALLIAKKRRVDCSGTPLKPHGTPGQPKPGLTPISCHAVLERSACAPFIKERRMECINATSLHRKSGQRGTQPSLPVEHARQLAAASRLLSDDKARVALHPASYSG